MRRTDGPTQGRNESHVTCQDRVIVLLLERSGPSDSGTDACSTRGNRISPSLSPVMPVSISRLLLSSVMGAIFPFFFISYLIVSYLIYYGGYLFTFLLSTQLP
jgi:hypothetical protein